MRAVLVLIAAVGCGHAAAPAYRVALLDSYDVGEDATIVIDVPKEKLSDDDAVLVITRPDGTIAKESASVETANSKVRFGRTPPHPGLPPTITIPGEYKVELKVDDQLVAKSAFTVSRNLLDEVLPMKDIGDYKQVTRYTRPKLYGMKMQGKTYGAIFTLPWKVEARVEITIDVPGPHLKATWKQYEEEGTITLIEDNNVIFRERSESVTVSWYSTDKIIRMQAPTLPDLEKGIIGYFLKQFPSKLGAK